MALTLVILPYARSAVSWGHWIWGHGLDLSRKTHYMSLYDKIWLQIKYSFVLPICSRYSYRNCMKQFGFEFPCSRPVSTALLEVGPFTIDMAFDGMDCNLYRINASRRSLARKRWISRSCAKASLFWCSPTSEQKNCHSLSWHSGSWCHVTFGVAIHLGCLKGWGGKETVSESIAILRQH